MEKKDCGQKHTTYYISERVDEIHARLDELAETMDFCSIIHSQKADLVESDAEITRLKEQLARTERERDQAEGAGSLHIATITEDNASEIYDGWRNVGKTVILGIGATEKFIAGYEDSDPDIYARLAGKVEDA